MMHAVKNMNEWKIKVVFSGTLPPKEYITPDIRKNNPGWDSEIFKREIESLIFYLPTGHSLIMSGMEQYNFFVEATKDLAGGRFKIPKITAFWFCGKMPGCDTVEMVQITDGRILRQRGTWGIEYNGSKTRGWKKGSPGKPFLKII